VASEEKSTTFAFVGDVIYITVYRYWSAATNRLVAVIMK